MPTVPVSDAADFPEGVDAEAMLWAETIGAGGYASRVLPRGARLLLTDVEGDASPSLLLYNADDPMERLNVADTVKVQWNAYLGEGKLLLSDMGRVLMSIVGDLSGSNHDAFCGCSNERVNSVRYGAGGAHGPYPSARDRFVVALAKHGLQRRDIMPCLNLFKGVRIAVDGTISLEERAPTPGGTVLLRAEMRVLVVLANTPHPLDDRPEYRATPLRIRAWRGPMAEEGDPIRAATPEGLRAFQNVEDYYLSREP
jgi:urea carboxylase-associated protein 2